MKRVLFIIKRIHLKDLLAPFIFLLLLIPSWSFRLINKIRKRKLWLVAEHGEARDNGYHFYKYVRDEHPEDYCFYAVKINDPEYEKVAKLGNIIKYGGLKHWLYYMSANLNISSQKSGNPSPVFFGFIHTVLNLYKNRVFLQHGIIKDDLTFVYYKYTRFRYFVCGAKREYDYVLEKFGYSKNNLILSGLPRWDGLKDISKSQERKSILIMPTWRNWLGGEKNALFKTRDFQNTDFYKYWNGLLNDGEFIGLLESQNVEVFFYPHYGMQKYINSFSVKSENVHIVTLDDDIQKYFNKCSLMITDYSSAVFDFAYLKKPIIYYQFDLKEYRKRQHRVGYFSYINDGFGEVVTENNDLIKTIKCYATRGFKPKMKYEKRMDMFFNIRDKKNSDRVYGAIK